MLQHYGTEFNIDDIEEVTMLDRLPSGIRTNGLVLQHMILVILV